jgi:hypothetical protein
VRTDAWRDFTPCVDDPVSLGRVVRSVVVGKHQQRARVFGPRETSHACAAIADVAADDLIVVQEHHDAGAAAEQRIYERVIDELRVHIETRGLDHRGVVLLAIALQRVEPKLDRISYMQLQKVRHLVAQCTMTVEHREQTAVARAFQSRTAEHAVLVRLRLALRKACHRLRARTQQDRRLICVCVRRVSQAGLFGGVLVAILRWFICFSSRTKSRQAFVRESGVRDASAKDACAAAGVGYGDFMGHLHGRLRGRHTLFCFCSLLFVLSSAETRAAGFLVERRQDAVFQLQGSRLLAALLVAELGGWFLFEFAETLLRRVSAATARKQRAE